MGVSAWLLAGACFPSLCFRCSTTSAFMLRHASGVEDCVVSLTPEVGHQAACTLALPRPEMHLQEREIGGQQGGLKRVQHALDRQMLHIDASSPQQCRRGRLPAAQETGCSRGLICGCNMLFPAASAMAHTGGTRADEGF